MESNDSPEILDRWKRGETSDTPGLPSGSEEGEWMQWPAWVKRRSQRSTIRTTWGPGAATARLFPTSLSTSISVRCVSHTPGVSVTCTRNPASHQLINQSINQLNHHLKLIFFSSPTDCVCERERERERGRGGGRERERTSGEIFFLHLFCFM